MTHVLYFQAQIYINVEHCRLFGGCSLPGTYDTVIARQWDSSENSNSAEYGVANLKPSAQTAFTLDDAMAFGVAHSPVLAAARARVEAGRGRLLSARSRVPLEFDPGVSIGGEEAVAVVTQRFEISGRRSARTSVAEYGLQIDQSQYEATKRDLTRDIKVAYADLVAAQSSLIVATDVTDVIRRLRDSVQKQVEVGEVPAQELI